MFRRYLLVFLIFFSFKSWAGIFLEPYYGTQNGGFDYKFKGLYTSAYPDKYHDDVSGNIYGGRFGVKFKSLLLGLDVNYMKGHRNVDSNIGASPDSGDFASNQVYAILGGQISRFFRLWGGYAVSNTASYTYPGTEITYEMDSYKIGLGISPLSFISFNIEYVMNQPKSYKNNGVKYEVSTIFEYFNYNAVLLSVSIPIYLFDRK